MEDHALSILPINSEHDTKHDQFTWTWNLRQNKLHSKNFTQKGSTIDLFAFYVLFFTNSHLHAMFSSEFPFFVFLQIFHK